MGYDLTNEQGDYFRFGQVAWHKLLALAELGGWQPAGTERPAHYKDPALAPSQWDGSYTANAGQWVSAHDAAALAMALEGLLDDIPDATAPDLLVDYGQRPELLANADPSVQWLVQSAPEGASVVAPNANLSPLDFFGGEQKAKVRAFVAYCRAGGFEVW